MVVLTSEEDSLLMGMPFRYSFDTGGFRMIMTLNRKMAIGLIPLRLFIGAGTVLTAKSDINAFLEQHWPQSTVVSLLDRLSRPFQLDWNWLAHEYTIQDNPFFVKFHHTNAEGQEREFDLVSTLVNVFHFKPLERGNGRTTLLAIDIRTLEAAIYESDYMHTPYEFQIEKLSSRPHGRPSYEVTNEDTIRRLLIQYSFIMNFNLFDWDTANNECTVELSTPNHVINFHLKGLKF
jgi:hypothetical protein